MSTAAGALALLLSVALLWARRLDAAAQLCALQALVAALVLIQAGGVIAVVAFALNGLALPIGIARMGQPEMRAWRAGPASTGAAVFIVVAASVTLFALLGGNPTLAPSAAVVLLGLVMAALRSHPMATALALVSSQNGLVLIAAAGPHRGTLAMTLAAVPLLPMLLLADARGRR